MIAGAILSVIIIIIIIQLFKARETFMDLIDDGDYAVEYVEVNFGEMGKAEVTREGRY